MSFFDSGAADLGTSLSGGATGGLQGYIQGLQLGDQREKHALEMEQLRRVLKNPHITALAHGAWLEQAPTGEIKFHQDKNIYPGGIDNFLAMSLVKDPSPENWARVMGIKYGRTEGTLRGKEDLLGAQTSAAHALENQRDEHGNLYDSMARRQNLLGDQITQDSQARRDTTAALTKSRNAEAGSHTENARRLKLQADELEKTNPDQARIIRGRADLLAKRIEMLGKGIGPGMGDPMKRMAAEKIDEILAADPNAFQDPVLREQLMYWKNVQEFAPGMSVEPVSKLAGAKREAPPSEPGVVQQAFEKLTGKQQPTGPSADPERRKKADEFILSSGYRAALTAKKSGKLPNGAPLTPDDKLALDEAIAAYTKEHAGR